MPLIPFGLTNEPEKLVDYAGNTIYVEYSGYDSEYQHYLVCFDWYDDDGDEWHQYGRMAWDKGRFDKRDQNSLERFKTSKGEYWYFYTQSNRKLGKSPLWIAAQQQEKANKDENIPNLDEEDWGDWYEEGDRADFFDIFKPDYDADDDSVEIDERVPKPKLSKPSLSWRKKKHYKKNKKKSL